MKKRITVAVKIVSLSFLFSTHLKANRICGDTFKIDSPNFLLASTNDYSSDVTQSFIAYLSILLEQQSITQEELLRFTQGLKEDRLINPIQNEYAETSSTAFIQHAALDEYLSSPELDRSRLLNWATTRMEDENQFRRTRKQLHIDTEEVFQKMIFNPVPPGKFAKVTLTHHTEAMSTLVTQYHWVNIMGKNPSYFQRNKRGPQTFIRMNGGSVMLQPDHPVENITWWSAIVYANKVSEKHGLPPAYDFSDITWKHNTDAASGTLDVAQGILKINAPGGDYYQTKGYRLPTEAEQQYLLRAMGNSDKNFFFGDDEAQIQKYAWYKDNSQVTTQPVAQLKPFFQNDVNFYDIYGNVKEWGWDAKDYPEITSDDTDSADNSYPPMEGTNPVSSGNLPFRIYRDGGWHVLACYCRSDHRGQAVPYVFPNSLGLRLWRTVE